MPEVRSLSIAAYHRKVDQYASKCAVLEKLTPLLENQDPKAFEWLKKECRAV